MAELTESVSFRTTPELKMHYAEKAAQLGISLSEYLTLCLKEYERIKSQPQPSQTPAPATAAPVGQNLSADDDDDSDAFPLPVQEFSERLNLIMEMITDRLTPMAIDEVEKQTIINAAKVEFLKEFSDRNILIPTDASVPGGMELKLLFNKILDYRLSKGYSDDQNSVLLDLIDVADAYDTGWPGGISREIKAIRKLQKDAKEALNPSNTEEV